MWDYLSEFWDAITETVVSVNTYTVEWFQNIGNAVAGAIGGLFAWLIHYFNDGFVFLGWIFSILKEIILVFTLPIFFIFNFLKAFTISAFSTPIVPSTIYSFSPGIMAIFETLPYWDTIGGVLGFATLIVIGVAILKILLQVS